MYLAIQNAQINDANVRLDSHDGMPHIVAPVVAVQEQVLKGELLPQSEIAASAASFSGRPLPVGHPVGENDEFVSANSPEIWDSEVVGKLFGTEESDTQLRGEVWVNVFKSLHLGTNKGARYAGPLALLARHLDGGIASLGRGENDDADPINDDGDDVTVNLPENIVEALEKLANKLGGDDPESDDAETANAAGALEVSTAYWYEPDGETGEYEGESYSSRQLNIKPDHLALLPASIGECSVKDGCGAARANQSGGQKVLADGGQRANNEGQPPVESDGETEFAFARDETKDGETIAGNEPNDDGNSGGLLSGFSFGGWPSFGFGGNGGNGGNSTDELGTDVGGCGCDHDDDPNMENEEIAAQMGITVEALEAMSDDDRATYEAAAQAKATLDDDDVTGGNGTDDGNGDDSPDDPGGNTANTDDGDGAALFDSREAMGSFISKRVSEAMTETKQRETKVDIAHDITHFDPDYEADDEAAINELAENNTVSMLEKQRELLANTFGSNGNGAGGFGGAGGAGSGRGGDPGSDPFTARVMNGALGENSEDNEDQFDGSISAAHSADAAVLTDGGDSQTEDE